jgi:hypothetical protein
MGPAKVTRYQFELFHENEQRFMFFVKASNVKRKEGVLTFVAAKSDGHFSKGIRGGHQNLTKMNTRAPHHVVKPYVGALLFLPRYRGTNRQGRQVYGYMTEWLRGHSVLDIGPDRQFLAGTPPKVFSRVQTEAIRGRIIELVARTFNPASGDCADVPDVPSGDCMVTRPAKGAPRVKLVACRRIARGMTPPKLISRLVQAKWPVGRTDFPLCPEDPLTLFDALDAVVGKREARTWLKAYLEALKNKQFRKPPLWAADDLRKVIE